MECFSGEYELVCSDPSEAANAEDLDQVPETNENSILVDIASKESIQKVYYLLVPSKIIPSYLENIIMQSLDQVSPGGSLLQQLLVVSHQLSLPALDPRHLRLQLLDLIYLPLPAVLRRHLVLPSPPDVSTQSQLLLSQLVLAQQVIELVHGQVDDVSAGDWETHLCCLPLITC